MSDDDSVTVYPGNCASIDLRIGVSVNSGSVVVLARGEAVRMDVQKERASVEVRGMWKKFEVEVGWGR